MIAKSLFHAQQHHPPLTHQSPTEEIVLCARQQTGSWKLLFEECDYASYLRKHKLCGKERGQVSQEIKVYIVPCWLYLVNDRNTKLSASLKVKKKTPFTYGTILPQIFVEIHDFELHRVKVISCQHILRKLNGPGVSGMFQL